MVLFRSGPRTFRPDTELDVLPGWLRRAGFDPRVVIALARSLRSDPVDVVVAHGGEPYKYARLAVPQSTRLVYYRIGVSQDRAVSGLRRAGYRMLARRADLVAGVSEETLVDAHEVMGVATGRLRLIPNGRDVDVFETARRSLVPRGERPVRLIWVGHLTTGKRAEWFVETVARLGAEGIDLEATLVGDGPLLGPIRESAERAGISVLGHRSDVPSLLSSADVCCFTSSGESEGMPGVLIEAGLAGLPTVATAVAGASTVIDSHRTGVVTAVDDIDAFVAAVRRLVLDEALRTRMGLAALERCSAEFTIDASVAKFQKALDELVGAGMAPR